VEWWIVDGTLSAEPVKDAETVFVLTGMAAGSCPASSTHTATSGWASRAPSNSTRRSNSQDRARRGRLLLRDAGSPTDTRTLTTMTTWPRIIRHGRHLARPRRYQRGFAIEWRTSRSCRRSGRAGRWGDGWVKLVADWIDRDIGDLAPLWSDEILKQAIDAAHDNGARVTAHVFSEDALPGLNQRGHRLHRTRHRADDDRSS